MSRRFTVKSGNVGFDGSSVVAGAIEAAIETRFGFAVPVVLRTHDELESVVRANPFVTRANDVAQMHVEVYAVHAPGVRLACPECGQALGVYDHFAR